MAVHLFTGSLGHGKTLSALGWILEKCLLKGGTVFTNLALFWEPIKAHALKVNGVEFQDRQLVQLTPEQCADFSNHVQRGTPEVPTVLVIDEAGQLFDSKAWNKDLARKMELSAFLRESRKLCIEVIMIVQREERLDKSFRELCEYRWTFLRLGWLPFIRNYIIQKQDHASSDVRIKTHWWRLDRRLFALYDTHALYSPASRACGELPPIVPVEFPSKPRKEIPLMFRVLMLVALLWVGWTVVNKITSGLGKKAAAKASEKVEPEKSMFNFSSSAGKLTGEGSVKTAEPAPLAVPVAPVLAAGPRVVVEQFRGTDERSFLNTASGSYRVGSACSLGVVTAVRPGAAYGTGFDGLPFVVVGSMQAAPVAGPVTVQAQVAAQARAPLVPAEPLIVGQSGMTALDYARAGMPSPENEERIWAARSGIPLKSEKTESMPKAKEKKPAFRGMLPDIRADFALATAMPSDN